MKRIRTSLSAATAIGSLVALGLAGAPQASADGQRRAITHTTPSWVAGAHSTGRASSKKQTALRVYLAPKGGLDALKADVAAVSDPASSSYRHFISAAAYHRTYDATSAETAKVADYLKTSGLRVTSTEAHHRYLSVSGTNAAVEKTFGVTLRNFRHRGQDVQANTSDATVPEAIASDVLTVTGLDTTAKQVKPASTPQSAPPPAGFRNGRPCSSYYGQLPATYKADNKTPLPKFKGKTLPYAVCGYTGPYLRAAYEGATALTGSGSTVAITDAYASPTIASDANTYAENNGDGSYVAGQLTQDKPAEFTHQPACGPAGWYGEETLDVEAVHAMAPNAKILYYASSSCLDSDFGDTLARVVDDNKASVVSNSWADTEANENPSGINAYQQVFLQGALQGVSFVFSSGDDGDELANTGLKQVVYPASDPYVTALGGTSDAIGASGSFTFQTGWGTENYSLNANSTSWVATGFLYGAGGGESNLFNMPDYQQGVVPGTNGSGRAVPDIAMDADPNTGMLIGETQAFPEGNHYGEYRIGGTSLAAPLFAGMSALREQHAGGRLGFQNPRIYKSATRARGISDVAGTPNDAGNIRVNYVNGVDATDGVSYLVRTFNQDSSLTTGTGWDNVTGVGSPNPSWLKINP